MKKLDKLILSSFIGPFILTFLVVVFILLTQHMLKYFDDIVGKDIGIGVLANLMFDFSIFMTPIAIPLAVLLSSLMTFGNLGEHFELTAVKSAGISLTRALLPIFIFVLGLTVLAFYSNNYFVPKAALNAYSLLYDIKQKKPAMDLKEGAFYNGIPDLSIKVNKKEAESGKIWDVIIYDHRDKNGNKKVTLADSGRMYTVFNDQYLILELYSGHIYVEGKANAKSVSSRGTSTKAESLSRVQFDKSKIVLDLSSFGMGETDKSLFSGNRIMRNISELTEDIDSLDQDVLEHQMSAFISTRASFKYLDQDRLPLEKKLVELKNLQDSLSEIRRKRRDEEFTKEDSINSEYLESEEVKFKEDSQDVDQGKILTRPVEKGGIIKADKLSDRVILDVSQEPKGVRDRIDSVKIVGVKKDTIGKYLREKTERFQVDAKDALKAVSKPQNKDIVEANKRRNRTSTIAQNPQILRVSDAATKKKNDDAKIDKTKIKKRKIETDLDIEKRVAKLNEFITDSLKVPDHKMLKTTVNRVRQLKSKIQNSATRIESTILSGYVFEVQWQKIVSNSMACIVMFLIGAPLGAIIKKGGLGFPVLISIFFFIVFYVLGMVGEKEAKLGLIDPFVGVWLANIILLPFGLFFLRQARNDARLFDADFYNVVMDKIKMSFKRKDS